MLVKYRKIRYMGEIEVYQESSSSGLATLKGYLSISIYGYKNREETCTKRLMLGVFRGTI